MRLEYIENGGLDCPLLLLSRSEPHIVRRLCDVLAGVGGTPALIHALRGIEPVGGCELSAVVGDRDRGIQALGGSCFRWELSPEGLAQVMDLLAPFKASVHGTAFQYLSTEGAIRLIISTGRCW